MKTTTVRRSALTAAIVVAAGVGLAGCELVNPDFTITCINARFTADDTTASVDNIGDGSQTTVVRAYDGLGNELGASPWNATLGNTGSQDFTLTFSTAPVANPITAEVWSEAGGDLAVDTVWYSEVGECATIPSNVTVVSVDGDFTNSPTPSFAVNFNEDVTGFDATDVVLGGTASPAGATVTPVSASEYTVTITGVASEGTIAVDIPAAAAINGASVDTLAAETVTVTYDATPPESPLIARAASQGASTSTLPIVFDITFAETPVGFDASDVVPSSGTASLSGSGTAWTVSVSGAVADGPVTVAIPAGAFTDAAGNANLTLSSSPAVFYTGTLPATGAASESALVSSIVLVSLGMGLIAVGRRRRSI
jgi:LPXTG-motif cell wall-anchored protein